MQIAPQAPPVAYLLADHLDAALAAAEDVMALGSAWPVYADGANDIRATCATQRQMVERLRALELHMLVRILKARERVADLATGHPAFDVIARLFAAGTVALADAVEESGDSTMSDFDTGDGLLPYLRSRGLVEGDAVELPGVTPVVVGESLLVAGRIPLGVVIEHVCQVLDALDTHFELYASAEDTAAAAPTVPKDADAEAVA